MIDTVILSIPLEQFQIVDYDKFSPSARGLFEPPYYILGARGHFECFLNPSKHDNEYRPRLTLSKRIRQGGFSIALKIELSLPKLIFGNNFDEMLPNDFQTVIQMLHYQLATMGIMLTYDTLVNATVTGIHYGKNIVLENKSTCALVINAIHKLKVSKRWDLGDTDFRNDGQAVRFHTNHCELTFYDKVKDLEHARISENRAIESDNAIQLDLFNQLKPQAQIMRMECRLNNRRHIKNTLQECNIPVNNLTFKELFSATTAQSVLLHFWDKFIRPSLNIVITANQSPQAIFTQLRSCGLKESDTIKCCGALGYIKEHGIRSLHQVLSPSGRTYRHLSNCLKPVDLTGNYLYNIFKQIETELAEFKAVKLADYPELQKETR